MAQRDRSAHATRDASKQRFMRKAIESASEYNLFINNQRRIERPVYMDSQTDTINYPVGLGRENKTLTHTNNIGRFPVAVMPYQYQDWYVEYTPEELKYLPVDTVLKAPIVTLDKLPPVLTTPNVSDFEDDDCASTSDGCSSCCSFCAADEQQEQSNDAPASLVASNNISTNDKTTPLAGNDAASQLTTTAPPVVAHRPPGRPPKNPHPQQVASSTSQNNEFASTPAKRTATEGGALSGTRASSYRTHNNNASFT